MRSVADLLVYLRAKGISLWSEGGKLCYTAPAGTLNAIDLAELQHHRDEILESIQEGTKAQIPVLVRAQASGVFPLTYVQDGFWSVERLLPRNSFSNMFSAFLISGTLHHAALATALNDLVERHGSLRTRFEQRVDRVMQIVTNECHPDLSIEDMRLLEPTQQQHFAAARIISESNRSIDLTSAQPFRVRLLRLRDNTHMLLLTVHHIVCDEWSTKMLTRELMELFTARMEGRSLARLESPVQLADFAVWQRELVKSNVLEPQLSYWNRQLSDGNLVALNLPLDYPRPQQDDFRTGRRPISLTSHSIESLRDLSRQESCTLFTVVVAIVSALLRQLTGADDVRVAAQMTTRNRPELLTVVGPLFDTFILRTNLSGQLTPRDTVRRVRETVLGAYEHQDLPFEVLLQSLERKQAMDRAGLARVLLLFGEVQPTAAEFAGVTIVELDVGRAMLEIDSDFVIESLTTFDLIISLAAKTEGMGGAFVFKTSLFTPQTINSFITDFKSIVADFIWRPDEQWVISPSCGSSVQPSQI